MSLETFSAWVPGFKVTLTLSKVILHLQGNVTDGISIYILPRALIKIKCGDAFVLIEKPSPNIQGLFCGVSC